VKHWKHFSGAALPLAWPCRSHPVGCPFGTLLRSVRRGKQSSKPCHADDALHDRTEILRREESHGIPEEMKQLNSVTIQALYSDKNTNNKRRWINACIPNQRLNAWCVWHGVRLFLLIWDDRHPIDHHDSFIYTVLFVEDEMRCPAAQLSSLLVLGGWCLPVAAAVLLDPRWYLARLC
jgi:hypothetical protein